MSEPTRSDRDLATSIVDNMQGGPRHPADFAAAARYIAQALADRRESCAVVAETLAVKGGNQTTAIAAAIRAS